METRLHSVRRIVDQCMLGCKARKPTCLGGSAPELRGPAVLCSGGHRHERAYGRAPGGGYRSRQYQSYPSLLCQWMAKIVLEGLQRMVAAGSGPTGYRRTATPIRRVTAWSTSAAAGAGPGIHVLNERVAHGCPADIGAEQFGHYLHVDDGVFLGPKGSEKVIDGLMKMSADGLEQTGFRVDDRTPCREMTKTLGYEVDLREGTMSLPLKKMLLLQESLRFLVSQSSVDVRTLSTLVGLWIWGALLKRDLLSIPQVIFRFMSAHENSRARWWRAAQREAATMAEAVLFMKVRLVDPVAPTLFATDARGPQDGDCGAFAVVAANVGTSLATRCAIQGVRAGHSVTRLDGVFTGRLRPEAEWTWTKPLSRLPEEVLAMKQEEWVDVMQGLWAFEDPIALGETRAVLKLLAVAAASPRAHGFRLVSLQDNTVCAAVFTKGRSPAPSMILSGAQEGFSLSQRGLGIIAAKSRDV